jgi:hypothetical protein
MTASAPPLDESFAEPAPGRRIDTAAAALRERNFTVYVADTVAEARKLVNDLLPDGRTVFTASSETLRLSGIAADVDESDRVVSVRRAAGDLRGDVDAQIRLGATPDVVVGSVHAVTEDGYLVAASASGSQLAPYASGARTAIWVVGAQKIVPDLPTALRRIRSYSLPMEWRRLHSAHGRGSFIGKILIAEREALPGRGTVILVREAIGF